MTAISCNNTPADVQSPCVEWVQVQEVPSATTSPDEAVDGALSAPLPVTMQANALVGEYLTGTAHATSVRGGLRLTTANPGALPRTGDVSGGFNANGVQTRSFDGNSDNWLMRVGGDVSRTIVGTARGSVTLAASLAYWRNSHDGEKLRDLLYPTLDTTLAVNVFSGLALKERAGTLMTLGLEPSNAVVMPYAETAVVARFGPAELEGGLRVQHNATVNGEGVDFMTPYARLGVRLGAGMELGATASHTEGRDAPPSSSDRYWGAEDETKFGLSLTSTLSLMKLAD
jgi:hypothetical protein